MAEKRKRMNPAREGLARAGNYVAPVDTVGMDESMKETLGMKPKPKPKKTSLFSRIKKAVGIKY